MDWQTAADIPARLLSTSGQEAADWTSLTETGLNKQRQITEDSMDWDRQMALL